MNVVLFGNRVLVGVMRLNEAVRVGPHPIRLESLEEHETEAHREDVR